MTNMKRKFVKNTTESFQIIDNKPTVDMLLSKHATLQHLRKFVKYPLLLALVCMTTQFSLQAHDLKQLKEEEIDPSVKEMLHNYDKKIYFSENKGQWPANVIYKADFKYGQAVATERGMLVGTFDPASLDAVREAGDEEEESIKNLLHKKLKQVFKLLYISVINCYVNTYYRVSVLYFKGGEPSAEKKFIK